MRILFVLVVLACYATLVGMCVWLLRQQRQQEQRQAEHNARLGQVIQQLETRLELYRAGSLRTGGELQDLRKIVKVFSERLIRLEQRDPNGESFSQAARLASMGATPDELTRQCGLTQAEAELVSRIQQQSRELT